MKFSVTQNSGLTNEFWSWVWNYLAIYLFVHCIIIYSSLQSHPIIKSTSLLLDDCIHQVVVWCTTRKTAKKLENDLGTRRDEWKTSDLLCREYNFRLIKEDCFYWAGLKSHFIDLFLSSLLRLSETILESETSWWTLIDVPCLLSMQQLIWCNQWTIGLGKRKELDKLNKAEDDASFNWASFVIKSWMVLCNNRDWIKNYCCYATKSH